MITKPCWNSTCFKAVSIAVLWRGGTYLVTRVSRTSSQLFEWKPSGVTMMEIRFIDLSNVKISVRVSLDVNLLVVGTMVSTAAACINCELIVLDSILSSVSNYGSGS